MSEEFEYYDVPEDSIEEPTEEELRLASEAYMVFVERFFEYVKETDPEMWDRARAFASDTTDIPGIRIKLMNDNERRKDMGHDD